MPKTHRPPALLMLALAGCGAPPQPVAPRTEARPPAAAPSVQQVVTPVPEPPPAESEVDPFLAQAERDATAEGREVLATGRQMVEEGFVIRGGCWGFANAVYDRAGFPHRNGRRRTVFKGRKKGPYANVATFQPGDWLYYINDSWGDSPHSGIFVGWVDRQERSARILSYAGGGRDAPGRYGDYDLSRVYRVIRPAPDEAPLVQSSGK